MAMNMQIAEQAGPRIYTREILRERAFDRRLKAVQEMKVTSPRVASVRDRAIDSLLEGTIPQAEFAADYDLRKLVKLAVEGKQTIGEFIGAGSVSQDFFTRQQYEVDAGRDLEPLIFPLIYNVLRDASLPLTLNINTLGPGGVVFTEIKEGGEVKFASVNSSSHSVTLQHWAAGIEYSETIFKFNQLFRLPFMERQFGVAANAVQNDIHLSPILTYTYTTPNQTAASAVGTTLEEKYHNTIDAGITHSRKDTTFPRRGPYVILCATDNLSMMRKATTRVPQLTFERQSPEVFDSVKAVIAYDGWTGTRGSLTTTYNGVTANKAYLISLAYREMDLQSYYQQDLRVQRGDGDLSRFIVEQVIYDLWFSCYANPRACIEELTLPTS